MPTMHKKGDSVVHAAKPEWGHGEVLSVDNITHDGKPCQRLTIRFSRAGTKAISTAFAQLIPSDQAPNISQRIANGFMPTRPPLEPEETTFESSKEIDMTAFNNSGKPDPFSAANLALVDSDTPSPETMLAAVPEKATDPFQSVGTRLKNTLELYRFDDPSKLLDWAAAQTGMRDPLSLFSRHDLERHFQRFRINLDNHLQKLIPQVRKTDPKLYDDLIRGAVPGAKHALRRVDIHR